MENHEGLSELVRDFCRLYKRAAAEGRGDALFGADTPEKAAAATESAAIRGVGKAGFYFEFPFTDRPCMDLLLQYECRELTSPVEFVNGDKYGAQSFFDACARDESLAEYICGFSFDLSVGNEAPSIYLLPPFEQATVDYVPTMLESLGGAERTEQVMNAFAAAPLAWQPYYAGYMSGRPGAPTRLGFLVKHAYRQNAASLCQNIEGYARMAFSADGRELLTRLVAMVGVVDLQFDLYPDGKFGDGLGVTLDMGFNQTDPRKSAGYLTKGSVGEAMRLIESQGLADSRWRLMDQACFGVQRLARAGDRLRRVADTVRLNAVKVRFKNGASCLAKGYLLAQTSIL